MSTLFQQLLGSSFASLPDAVQRLHSIRGHGMYSGRATITRGANPIANLFAMIVGLPATAVDVDTTVEFVADENSETWNRNFGGARMASRLSAQDGLLCERLGPMQFRFAIEAREAAIYWRTVGVRLLGVVPLPASLFTDVQCREREQGGHYEFLVEASMPIIGRLIRYEGWLEPV